MPMALVSGENLLFEFSDLTMSSTSLNEMYLYNFPHWIGLGEIKTVTVTNVDDADNNFATIKLSNGTETNMTWNNATKTFTIAVTSSSREDVDFNVTMYNSSSDQLAKGNHSLRFRQAFNVTLKFYKNSNVTSTEVEAYDNEFQYALLRWRDPEDSDYSYDLKSPNYVKFLNSFGGLFPYYNDIEDDNVYPTTDEIYLYAPLSSGIAVVKVYENASYDLYVYDTKWKNTAINFYEFGKPIVNDQYELSSTVADKVPVETESDQTFDVFISAWEVYRWGMVKNFSKILLFFMVWAVLVVGISFLCVCWIPNPDVQTKAFAAIIGVLVLGTSPLFVLGVRMIWN